MSETSPQSVEPTKGTELSLPPRYPVMAKRSLASRAAERLIPARSRFLGFTWILALGGVMALLQGIQGDATQFYGIAESQLQSISFQHPVEIVDIPIVESQQVQQGERLLEVRRYDLDVNLQAIEEQINEIRAQQSATRNNASAEITSLGTELDAVQQSLTTEIDSLESRYRHNQALLDSISSETAESESQASPLQVKIAGLKSEKRRLGKLFQAKIAMQKQRLADVAAPGDARIAELAKKRQELQRQMQALVVRAPFSGSVGSVLFKRGEQVAAFNAVMSVQGRHPASIKGYIHEAVSNHVQIGQRVWVRSLNAIGDNQPVEGRVESLGSRIVEYPDRLKRNPLVSAWGREAIISVAPRSGILQGEKVSVLLERPMPVSERVAQLLDEYLPVAQVHAWVSETPSQPWTLSTDMRAPLPIDIDVSIDIAKPRYLEASGLVWDPARDAFLLISDEHSALFELTRDGSLSAAFQLEADYETFDLESISRDGQFLYLAASLSHSRKGKLPSARRKLLRLQLAQHTIASIESIDLFQVMVRVAENPQTEPRLRHFLRAALEAQDLDLESHAVIDNKLYLGFKSPLENNENTVIVKLETVDALFAGDPPEARIWLTLDLGSSAQGKRQRLSDIAIENGDYYLLSIASDDGKPISYLSRFDPGKRELSRIAEFPGLRAEGLDIESGAATIVFDGGGKSRSQWLRRKL